jgi:hypothetical protein
VVERLLSMQEAQGSIPCSSTILLSFFCCPNVFSRLPGTGACFVVRAPTGDNASLGLSVIRLWCSWCGVELGMRRAIEG